jgi:hypothetical protein
MYTVLAKEYRGSGRPEMFEVIPSDWKDILSVLLKVLAIS